MLYIYTFFLIILILTGVYAWPVLEMSDHAVILINLLLVLLGVKISGKITYVSKQMGLYVFAMIIGTVIFSKGINGNIIKTALSGFIIMQIFNCNKSISCKILYLINNIFFYIIAIGIGLFLLYKVGLHMPSIGTINYYQYYLGNHIFFVSNLADKTIRYYGFCVEPGYFALLLSCLICINKYQINRYTIVYLIALFLTLSLGGILITGFCWFLYYSLSKGENMVVIMKRSVAFMILGAAIVFVLAHIGGIGDIFNHYIIDRLQFDPEKGFVGNNRMNERFDLFWYNFLMSDDILWGMGGSEYFSAIEGLELDGASYRVFVMQYGFIYTFLYFISFIFLSCSLGNKKFLLPVVFTYLLDFLQHGTPFQGVFLILFLLMSLHQRERVDTPNSNIYISTNN